MTKQSTGKIYVTEEWIDCTFCGGKGILYNNLWSIFDRTVIIPGVEKNLKPEEFEQKKEEFWQEYNYSWKNNFLPPVESYCEHCKGLGKEFNRQVLTKEEMLKEISE